MSFRPGLSLMRTCVPRGVSPAPARAFHYLSKQPGTQSVSRLPRQPQAIAVARSLPRQNSGRAAGPGAGVRAALAVGLGLAAFSLARPAKLDAAYASAQNPNVVVVEHNRPPPPQSMVSVPQLTFGATCGICAGVFVKKGFKLIAFALGGVFVLLQYLSSRSFVNIDWSKISKSYDGKFAAVDEKGNISYPTPTGVLNSVIDFLTANFQQRATFVAGFILGLRLG